MWRKAAKYKCQQRSNNLSFLHKITTHHNLECTSIQPLWSRLEYGNSKNEIVRVTQKTYALQYLIQNSSFNRFYRTK